MKTSSIPIDNRISLDKIARNKLDNTITSVPSKEKKTLSYCST